MQFNEFEYHFACSRKDVSTVHLCFIMSPGKNDICSFGATTVALTVSFKLISFKYLYLQFYYNIILDMHLALIDRKY